MKLEHITKNYYISKNKIEALKDVTIEFKENSFYAIMGRSGSGKTTLVNIIGLLDDCTSGNYYLDNIDVTKLKNDSKSEIISKNIGFVFQSFYLNNNLTAIENVMLATFINKNINKADRKQLAKDLLTKLGLKDRINHKPKELSGGEQQRVAIARALINNPKIIIADEPTGNLDSVSEKEVFEILKDISKTGKIVIVVSHNPIVKNYCDYLYVMNDGILTESTIWSLKMNYTWQY